MAAASSSNAQFVKKDALRRIVSDIKELMKNPLTAHGIYYEHDETDMLKGRALIIGPADTPYADGFYLFTFQFPANYPHAPPKVEFCTSDGVTRFNPNLYRTGKVCLSILNTWKGEPWSGCQTISSVLLALCTVLNDEPLLNEPGITKSHRDYEVYNKILAYKNIEVAIFKMLESVTAGAVEPNALDVCATTYNEFAIFGGIMRKYFLENKEKIRQRVLASETKEYTMSVYRMTVLTDYDTLLLKF
jgi:ubiquitin-protein ligase